MSNRTIAIIASVMAAVSFASQSVGVTLRFAAPAPPDAVRFDVRSSVLDLSEERVLVHLEAGGRVLDVTVSVGGATSE